MPSINTAPIEGDGFFGSIPVTAFILAGVVYSACCFVAFSCKQRCTYPSCHQKRALLTALHVAEEVCSPVAHRQVVLTIPKRLRLHTRFDRKLLGELCSCDWTCLKAEIQRLFGRDDVLPGMIAAIQTHGELLHWHPHIHALVTCGAFTPKGDFLEVPEFDLQRLQVAWQEAVFALYLAEGKIEPEVVENMRRVGRTAGRVARPESSIGVASVRRLINHALRKASGTCHPARSGCATRPPLSNRLRAR